jgi:hypothetical protein
MRAAAASALEPAGARWGERGEVAQVDVTELAGDWEGLFVPQTNGEDQGEDAAVDYH